MQEYNIGYEGKYKRKYKLELEIRSNVSFLTLTSFFPFKYQWHFICEDYVQMLCNDILGVHMYTRANFGTSRTRRYGKMDSFRFDDKVVVTFEEKKQSTKEFEYTYTIIYKNYIYSFVFSTKIPFFLFSLSSSFLYIKSYIFFLFFRSMFHEYTKILFLTKYNNRRRRFSFICTNTIRTLTIVRNFYMNRKTYEIQKYSKNAIKKVKDNFSSLKTHNERRLFSFGSLFSDE